ncbi:MAG: cytochrome c, partial [Thiogranum sp.]
SLLSGAATLALANDTETTAPTPEAADEAAPYTVVCEDSGDKTVCKVDKKTYIGWRTYHAACHVCHAQDAVGSTFAPSLVERLGVIDEERFMDVLANGYTGQIGVMPGWKDNPNVNKKYNELYGYLKARADGALPPGRPKKLP